jgi:hypothetical protein
MTATARGTALLVLVLALARAASAQGTMSTQGLGFPQGQLSTAAITMGGSTGETDPYSALNPASISLLSTPIVLMQAESEFRTVRIGGQFQRTSIARFPLFMGALPLGSRWGIGISASTLLDRTWTTSTRDTQVVNGETITGTLMRRSDGSINDLRLAVSYAITPWLRVGIGGHAFSGRDELETVLAFDDSARFLRDPQLTLISFGGNAVSVGAQTLWPRVGGIGVSYRRGGGLSVSQGSKTVGGGHAPDHMGVSVVYLGIRGTTLGVRAARDSWSRMQGLSRTFNAHEGWDIGVGGDVAGPAFGSGSPLALRAGFRWRTLPFSATATPVKERVASGGFALPMARNRVELNLGALYTMRTGSVGVEENAWTVSTGFAIRP